MIYTVLFVPGRDMKDPLVRLSQPQVQVLEALRAVDKVGEGAYALLSGKTERVTLGSLSWCVNTRSAKGLAELGLARLSPMYAHLTNDDRAARKPTDKELDAIDAAAAGGGT